jgi:hypothetical protein
VIAQISSESSVFPYEKGDEQEEQQSEEEKTIAENTDRPNVVDGRLVLFVDCTKNLRGLESEEMLTPTDLLSGAHYEEEYERQIHVHPDFAPLPTEKTDRTHECRQTPQYKRSSFDQSILPDEHGITSYVSERQKYHIEAEYRHYPDEEPVQCIGTRRKLAVLWYCTIRFLKSIADQEQSPFDLVSEEENDQEEKYGCRAKELKEKVAVCGSEKGGKHIFHLYTKGKEEI